MFFYLITFVSLIVLIKQKAERLSMNLKDKLEAESTSEPIVFLHMEGMFWKAYEQSAMRFVKEIKAYKLLKKHIKAIKKDVVSLGFPSGSLEDILSGREYTRENDKLVSFKVENVYTPEEFEEWKSQISLIEETSASESCQSQTISGLTTVERGVISQLMAFSVETASPIQCMMLVSNLQAQLKK